MQTPMPSNTDKHTEDGRFRVDVSLRVLVGVFAICIAVVFGLRWFFDDLENALRERGANERARLFVGEEIVRAIQGIEKDIYRMAATQNANGFDRVRRGVDAQLSKLKHDLAVLQFGGVSRRDLRLNIGGQDDLAREANYQPEPDAGTSVMEVIEIAPQLEKIQDLASTLAQQLQLRWVALEKGDRADFFAVEEEIALLLKQAPPYFERLDENANRLFLEGDQRLRKLEAELQIQRARLKQIETVILALVLILSGSVGILFMRRLSTALNNSRLAKAEVDRHREQRDTMLSTLSDGVYATDMAGNITFVNAAAEHILDWTSHELIGQQAHQAIHHTRPDGQHFAREQCPLMSVLSEGASLDGEDHFVARNGRFVPVSYRTKPLLLEGKIIGSLVSFQDISERYESEARIRLQRAALEEIGQGILITKADPTEDGPTIEYVNPAFTRITGYTADDVLGLRTGILRASDTKTSKITHYFEALTAGQSFSLEMNYCTKDGTPFVAELHYSPVHDAQGKLNHFIGLLSDIGSRKEAERALRDARDQALENSRLKSEFLSTMSHEIRTPMNGIIGMTDLLLDTALDEEQRDYTGVVRDSANALLTIINDILDFSKIEAGKLEIDSTDFSPMQVIEGTVELLRAKAREKGLALSSFVDPTIPKALRSDPTRLRQILLNLIGNAIKFTERGGVELRAECNHDPVKPMVRFEIRDTGIGISPATQARLFQSFTQADSSTTRKYGGTGLGLAISKQLVELMGGTIGISSVEGEGSTFWFTLPAVEALGSVSPLVEASALGVSQIRVLVVDDHTSDRKVLHRFLASWNLRNDGAGSGEEALKLMRDAADLGAPYSVALIDFSMPGMDGIELAAAIREDRRFDTTRLVLLTAHDLRELQNKAMAAGFADCLTKPVRQSQLFDSLTDNPATLLETVKAHSGGAQRTVSPNPTNERSNRRLILLAEDNLTNQKVAQLQINKLGYALQIVNNGKEALQAMAAADAPHYSAILMDCQMPIMDGFEATAALRATETARGAAERLPIIAMTANAMQGDRERCIAAGMDDYISKPIAPEQLSRVLAQWVGLAELTTDPLPPPHTPAPAEVKRDLQVIDFSRLEDIFDNDQELITNLLDIYQSTTVELLEKLSLAITQENHDTVAALGHEVKGSSGNLGLEQLADLAGTMERLALDGEWSQATELLADMRSAYQRVLDVLAAR